jgi:hypothetical protein
VVVGLALGTAVLTLGVADAAAQTIDVSGRGQCGLALLTLSGSCNDTRGGNARAVGGNGGLVTTVHDVGNAQADASTLVIGSTGVGSFAPAGSPQAGTTGGNSNIANSSGGTGGNARANGGNGGDVRGSVEVDITP